MGEQTIMEPRLRFRSVLLRGLGYGVIGLLAAAGWTVHLDDHQKRLDFIAVVSGLTMVVAIIGFAVGLCYWFCAKRGVLRWRGDSRAALEEELGAPSFVLPGPGFRRSSIAFERVFE